MTIFLLLDNSLKALNSDVFTFSDGLQSLGKLSYKDKDLSNNLAFVEDKSILKESGVSK